ncbi:hypothetical protein D3C71_1782730 [compost metagenome]
MDGRVYEVADRVLSCARMLPGDCQARHKTLHVPFPWSRRGFVEVIQIEDKLSFRRCKATEVHQVGVTADRKDHAGIDGPCEVMGLEDRAASKERERRHRHAPIA